MGREFLPQEDIPGGDVNKVILSHALWEKRFHGDPAILGRVIRTSLGSFTVVGVAAPGFLFPRDSALWIPIESELRARNGSRKCGFTGNIAWWPACATAYRSNTAQGRSPPDRNASSARLCRHQPRHSARGRAAARRRNLRHAALRAAADGRRRDWCCWCAAPTSRICCWRGRPPAQREFAVRAAMGAGRTTSPDPAPDRAFATGDRGRAFWAWRWRSRCSALCRESFRPSFPSGSTSIWTGTYSCSPAR